MALALIMRTHGSEVALMTEGEQGAGQAAGTQPKTLQERWDLLPEADQLEVLKEVYGSYTSRFISDNSRIWTTAASMIPLSLGSFVVLASIAKPTLAQIVLLSAASWILMTVWLVIAENHRAFQNASMQRLSQIEKIWGVEGVGSPKVASGKLAAFLTRPGRVRQMRFGLWLTVSLGSLCVIIFWPGGLLS